MDKTFHLTVPAKRREAITHYDSKGRHRSKRRVRRCKSVKLPYTCTKARGSSWWRPIGGVYVHRIRCRSRCGLIDGHDVGFGYADATIGAAVAIAATGVGR
eukprot:6885518-Prymnesium_polylepis.2